MLHSISNGIAHCPDCGRPLTDNPIEAPRNVKKVDSAGPCCMLRRAKESLAGVISNAGTFHVHFTEIAADHTDFVGIRIDNDLRQMRGVYHPQLYKLTRSVLSI